MSHILLIDGDILVYKIAFAMEAPLYVVGTKVFYFRKTAERVSLETGKPVKKRVHLGPREDIKRKLKVVLAQIFDDMGPCDYKIFLTSNTGEPNFRKDIATIQEYKGNRKNVRKPVCYEDVRKVLIKEWGAREVEGMEADDALAIAQHNTINENNDFTHSTIVSIDKDLLQVPGQHYNIDSRQLIHVSPEEGYRNFFKQVLTGDVTDNIPGLVRLLKMDNRLEEANSLVHHKYIKAAETAMFDLHPTNCYNYIFDLYRKFGYENKLPEIFNLLWLKRHIDDEGFNEFKVDFLGYNDGN